MTILFTSEDKEFQEKYPLHKEAIDIINRSIGFQSKLNVHEEIFYSPYAINGEINFSKHHMDSMSLDVFSGNYAHEMHHAKGGGGEIFRRFANGINEVTRFLGTGVTLFANAVNIVTGGEIDDPAMLALKSTTILASANYISYHLSRSGTIRSEEAADTLSYVHTGVGWREIDEYFDNDKKLNDLESEIMKGFPGKIQVAISSEYGAYRNLKTRKPGAFEDVEARPDTRLLELFGVDAAKRSEGKER